jgi:hypothetical protein
LKAVQKAEVKVPAAQFSRPKLERVNHDSRSRAVGGTKGDGAVPFGAPAGPAAGEGPWGYAGTDTIRRNRVRINLMGILDDKG